MVSVVVAVFNGEKYIIEQLRSVLFQTKIPDEVLIFDDCSTDGSVSVIERFIAENRCDGWRLIKNSENKGYCRNFLEGVSEAKGDYIFLADQDDIWHSEKLEKMVAVLEKQPSVKALCSSCDLIGGNGEKINDPKNIGQVFWKNDGSIEVFKPESFVGRSFIRGCSACFRRELLQYIKPIELKGLLSHDWLITFLAALTGECAVYNRTLLSYRCHGENTSFGQRKYGHVALEKRIAALEYSVEGHGYILSAAESLPNFTRALEKKIKCQIKFEQKRIDYLKNGGFLRFSRLCLSIFKYRCYHRSVIKGVKVFLGDFLYKKHSKK